MSETAFTPSWESDYDDGQFRAFLTMQGYRPNVNNTYLKEAEGTILKKKSFGLLFWIGVSWVHLTRPAHVLVAVGGAALAGPGFSVRGPAQG